MGNRIEVPLSIQNPMTQINAAVALKYRGEQSEKEYQRILQREQIDNQKKTNKLLAVQNKLLEEQLKQLKITEKSETDSLPPSLRAKLFAVYAVFKQFQNDFADLLDHGFIKLDLNNECLETPYKKGFLFDYFKFISENKKVEWYFVEKLFTVENLRSALGARTMLTEGMEKWAELKGIDKKSIENKVFYNEK